jgi:2-dehydropantoate 2-reductase
LVARGARLQALEAAGGRLRVRHKLGGAESTCVVGVAGELAVPAGAPPVDVLFVTVRRQHADAVLGAVAASEAKQVVFVFNIAEDLTRFRDAVGAARFAWLFPAMIAGFEGDVLVQSVLPGVLRPLQVTTMGGLADLPPPQLPALAQLLQRAGFPYAVCPDMASWLQTHAAFMASLIAAAHLAGARGHLTPEEARLVATGMGEGFAVVRRAGSQIVPTNMALLARLPTSVKAAAFGAAFRLMKVRSSFGGQHARCEALAMFDDLIALAGGDAPALVALRGLAGVGPGGERLGGDRSGGDGLRGGGAGG